MAYILEAWHLTPSGEGEEMHEKLRVNSTFKVQGSIKALKTVGVVRITLARSEKPDDLKDLFRGTNRRLELDGPMYVFRDREFTPKA
jgi:hypothetical protein